MICGVVQAVLAALHFQRVNAVNLFQPLHKGQKVIKIIRSHRVLRKIFDIVIQIFVNVHGAVLCQPAYCVVNTRGDFCACAKALLAHQTHSIFCVHII